MLNLNLYPWRETVYRRQKYIFTCLVVLTSTAQLLSTYYINDYLQTRIDILEKNRAQFLSHQKITSSPIPKVVLNLALKHLLTKLLNVKSANICMSKLKFQNNGLEINANSFSYQRMLVFINDWQESSVQLLKFKTQDQQISFKLRVQA